MTSEFTPDLEADWSAHHIEGFARAAEERGVDAYFSCPLISEVAPGLWQGGCIDGVRLPSDFDLVVSLYPWEKYAVGSATRVIERFAYDAATVPDLSDLVETVYESWKGGNKVLVHCQAGLNRSGLLAAQVLIKDGYSPAEAIRQLRDSRSSLVLCNEAFERALLTLEAA